MKDQNARTRDFDDLRNKMRCIYCHDKGQYIIEDAEFWEIQDTISGAAYIDECKLYRYSPANEWNICNLSQQTLHLSPVGTLNDMFEGIAPSQQQQISAKDWDELGKLVSIKCFSENWNNLLMWAHYADGGRGMCVEYDLALLNGNEPVLQHLFPVHYSSHRYIKDGLTDIHAEIQTIKNAIATGSELDDSAWLKDMMAFYLTKSSEWAYEQEWRIVVPQYNLPSSKSQLQITDGNIDFCCVSAVYLGCKMPIEKKRWIRHVVEKVNARIGWKIEIHELIMEGNGYNLHVK